MVYTEFTYDERGRKSVQTRPNTGNATSTQGAIVFTHDVIDRVVRVTRPDDTLGSTRWTAMQYGSLGDPGALDSWLSGSAGRVRGIRRYTSDGQRSALVRTFDAEGRLVSALEQHDAESETPTTTYVRGLDAPMAIAGPDGDTLRTNFDLLGRAEETTDPSSGKITQRYDGFGRLREERDNQILHQFDYDLLDRPVSHSRSYEGTDAAFGDNCSRHRLLMLTTRSPSTLLDVLALAA